MHVSAFPGNLTIWAYVQSGKYCLISLKPITLRMPLPSAGLDHQKSHLVQTFQTMTDMVSLAWAYCLPATMHSCGYHNVSTAACNMLMTH